MHLVEDLLVEGLGGLRLTPVLGHQLTEEAHHPLLCPHARPNRPAVGITVAGREPPRPLRVQYGAWLAVFFRLDG